jgi:hypothetical protein
MFAVASAHNTASPGSVPLPVIAARLRPGFSGTVSALINFWPLSQPALRRRGTEVTCPKPSACTSACCLTLRSAATPHGKPLGRRGALVYAAPRRPSALPRGSRLAQTLGITQHFPRPSGAEITEEELTGPGSEISRIAREMFLVMYATNGAGLAARAILVIIRIHQSIFKTIDTSIHQSPSSSSLAASSSSSS